MPFNPQKSGRSDGPSFFNALHGSFLDTRRDMELARKAVGTAEWTLKERLQARDNAYEKHTALFAMAKNGELLSSLFKDLNDAEDTLREAEATLDEAKVKLEAAKKKETARVETFEQAKFHCESSRCPNLHSVKPLPEDTAEEDLAKKRAKKAAKEQQQQGWHQWSDEARKRRKYDESQHNRASSHARAETRGAANGAGHRDSATDPRRKVPRPAASAQSTSTAQKSQTYKEWLLTLEKVLGDYASLSSFPSPPAKRCSKPACVSDALTGARKLTACACNIRQGLQHLSTSELKSLRLKFHPDKFSKCHADQVELFKKQASEIFVVVDAMYRAKK